MKIKVNRNHHYGKKLVVPILGEVEVSEKGEIEIEDEEIARMLVEKGSKSFSLAKGETGVKTQKKAKKEKTTEEGTEADELEGMSLKDLISIAKESKLQGWQILSKNPEKLKAWLTKKLKAV